MKSFKHILSAFAGVSAAALWATAASAAIPVAADLNADGQVTVADTTILTSCALGTCSPAATTLCGGVGLGNAIPASSPSVRCGDTFGDGNTTTLVNADLAVLARLVAGLGVDYEPAGASVGTIIAGCTGSLTLPTCTAGTCSGGARNALACADDTDCPTVIKTGDITASEIWPANCRVLISDTVDVITPTTATAVTVLTIAAGNSVVGDTAAAAVPALIVSPGARIVAQGSAAAPIIFTSNNPPRSPNDWGGISINGKSTVNRPGCLNESEGLPFEYGGCIADDNSGVVSYARVEFAGRLFSPDNELNNFTMNGVGSGTRVDHLMAATGADDCIEWFGGTVNTDHLVAANCGDDGFDWQLGWTGSLQFGLYMHNQVGNYSAGASQSRGIEADNSEFGFEDLPRSNPGLCNVTLVGNRTTPQADGQDRGILFRRGTAAKLANVIVANFKNEGVNVNDLSTAAQACNAGGTLGTMTLSDSIFWTNGSGGTVHAATGTIAGGNCTSTSQWYGLNANNPNANGSNGNNPAVSVTYPAGSDLYDTTRPGASAFTPTAGACLGVRDSFVNTSYAGAFDPAAACNTTTGPCDWLAKPWVNFQTN